MAMSSCKINFDCTYTFATAVSGFFCFLARRKPACIKACSRHGLNYIKCNISIDACSTAVWFSPGPFSPAPREAGSWNLRPELGVSSRQLPRGGRRLEG
jgi:hypothetical protein